jgi:predicted nucleic acid-binding protein
MGGEAIIGALRDATKTPLTRDDLLKQEHSRLLFEQIEQGALTVAAPDTVIADAVFVLVSKRQYNKPRAEVAALLNPVVRLPHFRVKNRRSVLRALSLYGATPELDFGDALLLALMHSPGPPTIYSYDTDFDHAGMTRHEP